MSTDSVTMLMPRREATRLRLATSERALSVDAPQRPSEEHLALEAQRGSIPAFTELVSRFEMRLYNFLLRRVGHAPDAEDLSQETFLRAWSQIHRYHHRFRFSTWLFTIASRLAVDHHRARKPRLVPTGEPAVEVSAIAASTSATAVSDLPDGNIWDIAAALLNDEQHSAMWLRYAEDLSNAEIGRVLGRTSLGVRVILHRARGVLAHYLNAAGTKEGQS